MRLLADRILVKPDLEDSKTPSGIIIPDMAKEKPQRGTIVGVGPGTIEHGMSLKEGDVVLYGKFCGVEYKIDGQDYLFMRENDIFAVIDK